MALAPPGEGTPATPAPTLPRTGTNGSIETAAANAGVTVLAAKPPEPRSPARYLWAKLIASIHEVFPLVCLRCAGQMRIIAFILDAPIMRTILDHLGEDSRPPRITPTTRLGRHPVSAQWPQVATFLTNCINWWLGAPNGSILGFDYRGIDPPSQVTYSARVVSENFAIVCKRQKTIL